MQQYDLLAALAYIDPAGLCYQDWVNVGMGLKESGYSAADWEAWSRRDSRRYHPGECARKWESFRGSGNPITGGTIVQLAQSHGWTPPRSEGKALEWDDMIGGSDDLIVVNQDWIEAREVNGPQVWDPVQEVVSYLEVLFDADDHVGYVTRSYEKDGRHIPSKGCFDRTAGRLIHELGKCGGDLGGVLGDYDPAAGAWIRFNPLDGKGVKNENVTDFRYALVESDSIPIEKQNAIIRELELPVAALVHSGGKSIHAIVRIEAASYEEYRARVDYLYDVCKKNGLEPDRQNRNPSRLSRMPGVLRGGHKQFLIDTNLGKASWAEWKEWIESASDDLPDTENMADAWADMPELAPPLIEGVLRQGHKLLLAGPSKAGKSFSLIELCICIAEGRDWLGFHCAQGRVMYVNLELDRASCLHRFRDVYEALGAPPENLGRIDIWNLRGKSVPMDKLAPKLIRRALKKDYIAVIIDPIYKVITGDENSADQMAKFCNQFDKVCTELGTAVIYCHHHSKGAQGGKRSMDRASGSGVFARDPDALLDLIELPVSEDLQKQAGNEAVCACCKALLDAAGKGGEISQDDACSAHKMLALCKEWLAESRYLPAVEQAKQAAAVRTAWRLEGTLREFPRFPTVNMWFDYPVHRVDCSGVLADVQAETEAVPWRKAAESRKKAAKAKRQGRQDTFEDAVQNSNFGDPPTVKNLCEYLGGAGETASERTVRDWIKRYGYQIDRNSGCVRKKQDSDPAETGKE